MEPAAATAAPASTAGSVADQLELASRLYDLYGRWYDTASNALAETGVEAAGPQATRVYLLLGLAQNHAARACLTRLSDNGSLSDALFNRCIAGASVRILVYLFPGDGETACAAIQSPIPGRADESGEIPYNLIAAQVIGQLEANDVINTSGALLP